MKTRLARSIFISLRPSQWVKNFAVFAPIIFTGNLFTAELFWKTCEVFVAFCLLSSSSYLLNDIVDKPLDLKYPVKCNRPIARGDVSLGLAKRIAFWIYSRNMRI